jgi:phospholipid/cholesterol/gamma-HCH transport system permease protein
MLSEASGSSNIPPKTQPLRMEVSARDSGESAVQMHGDLRLREGSTLWARLHEQRPTRGSTLNIDLSDVHSADGSAIALLTAFRAELHYREVKCEFVGVTPALQEIVRLYGGGNKPARHRKRRPQGLLDQIGHATQAIGLEAQLVIAFFGQMMLGAINAARAPRSMNWKELTPTMERAGADAVPIVALINFLVGMVIGLQSASQLKRFGADIFMADLVGISVVREIGPLMTAIVVCGRTGAAFAAELGSMKTNEEIDALRTLGFGPMRFLVIPRALALMIIAPLLTLIADLAGGIGGLVVGVSRLDLTVIGYFNETQRAVHMHDISAGLIKSMAFGLAIALISSQQGLAATGGAEGVGRRTTSAVVTTLFSLILIDAIFTVFFEASGFL